MVKSNYMEQNKDDTILEIDDIYLGAFFLLSGCQIISKRNISQKVLFTFQNPAGSITELRHAYYLGATGKLSEFSHNIVTMKQLLF